MNNMEAKNHASSSSLTMPPLIATTLVVSHAEIRSNISQHSSETRRLRFDGSSPSVEYIKINQFSVYHQTRMSNA